jgi:hypothetical protein
MANLIDAPAVAQAQSRLRGQLMNWLAEIGDDLPGRVDRLRPPGMVMATGGPGP